MTSFWLTHLMAGAGTGWRTEGRGREAGVFLPTASGLSVRHWPFLPGSPIHIHSSNTTNWGRLYLPLLLQLPTPADPWMHSLHACSLYLAHTLEATPLLEALRFNHPEWTLASYCTATNTLTNQSPRGALENALIWTQEALVYGLANLGRSLHLVFPSVKKGW